MKRYITLILAGPALAFGHGGDDHTMAPSDDHAMAASRTAGGITVDAGVAATYRTDTVMPEDGSWQIPGVLMGGDAHGTEDAFTLDSASLHLNWRGANRAHAALELGSHHDGELELEEALAGYQLTDTWQASLEAGRMKARFSPENLTHAYARPFSENNLIYNAFYGGHYVDEGARLRVAPLKGLEVGLEAWRGGQFPATPGEDGMARDAYVHWHGESGRWRMGLGAWVMLADASGRSDDRNDDGHNHSAGGNENDDLRFTGDQDSAGLRVSLGWQGAAGWQLGVSGELVQVDVDGLLRDTTRQAALEGDYLGWWLQPELHWQRHAVAVRYEQLVLDNHLVGAGAEALAGKAGLAYGGSDPDWLGLSYRYQLEDGFGVRAEWTRNRSTGDEVDYIGLGIYWAQPLWGPNSR